jgi:hypothetical protein
MWQGVGKRVEARGELTCWCRFESMLPFKSLERSTDPAFSSLLPLPVFRSLSTTLKRLVHLMHCVDDCAAPKVFATLK